MQRNSPIVIVSQTVLRQMRVSARASGVPERKKKDKQKAEPKKKVEHSVEIRLLPYVPQEHVKDTIQFLGNKDRLRALLDVIFSPHDPTDTDEQRAHFQRRFEAHERHRQLESELYEGHEAAARERMWEAVQQLPEDLYDEATASEDEPLPEALQFHHMYRQQLMDREMSAAELRKLQCFMNLSFVRFPHRDVKRRTPDVFWIPETQAISRQKEAARKRLKKKV
ncbi:unnamed protein product [Vitrella brassicaformis CCMP3155]|uniref:Uncharacterized protein n=1 Tax=Vitrella brassicaformis (strain CCMP3155) TaxID=1169540 RepID=A0A0G4EYJ0_VITBC|nr:unnamed protein product [Vitrella brassicaformis CCMP3155]|eukprot:CEM04118.1 unnamed protein product [Vitrella brassicaformis CCMP3155]